MKYQAAEEELGQKQTLGLELTLIHSHTYMVETYEFAKNKVCTTSIYKNHVG
jgi:hypothetical protein